jgi:hypothetical protein
MTKTIYSQTLVLNSLLNASNLIAPTSVYLALFTTMPTDYYSPGSIDGVEVSGNAYARQVISFGTPLGDPTACSNATLISFPQASGSWGVVVAIGIFDAITGGNLLYYGNLTANQYVAPGNTVKFTIGSIIITEN